ncbi:MAG: chemotaxis-specific protein-glutamate methyltransferase CheB [Candidatus Methanoperedens sp.]|nr:chemotaxis-specific protein-glutamate methyltransferase CheB [Candidatus Methanoperedens sp.]
MDKTIKVLIVEDSPVARELLEHILTRDEKIKVIGNASSGEEAILALGRLKPDVITMDIHLPEMDGFETTRLIMETHPLPIVIVTGTSRGKDVSMAMNAIEAGALAIVQKPLGIGHPDYEAEAVKLVQTVKLMSEVRVVRRWARYPQEAQVQARTKIKLDSPAEIKIVAIGASTGGPPAIQKILSGLPKKFPVPVLIVQHIAEGFIQGFADWLGQTSSLPVHVALHGEYCLPGHVYIAPDLLQMKVKMDGRIWLSKDDNENGLCPSVSFLFRSVAEEFGNNAAGVLLTGMGKDGAKELKTMKEKGATTFAQDKESSVIHGMPGEAIDLNAAIYVLSPEKIAVVLADLVDNCRKKVVVN